MNRVSPRHAFRAIDCCLLELFLGNPTKRITATRVRKAIVARFRKLGTKLKAPEERRAALREATALLEFLRRNGCSFHRCSALLKAPAPLAVAYRYDIHVRDIPGARVLADFHHTRGVPATFFLFWGYSALERQHFREFRALRKLVSDPLEFGLHDSPIDAFLIRTKFDGNRREYANWTDSEDALEWLEGLTSDPQRLARLDEGALEDFVARVRETRAHFGPFSLVAGHGGELGQNLRRKLPFLPPAVLATAEGLRARYWLTPERVTAAGLELCSDWNHQSLPGWSEVSDNGGQLSDMARVLRHRMLKEGNAIQLLLHPYTWAGGKRDAELSDLLRIDEAIVT